MLHVGSLPIHVVIKHRSLLHTASIKTFHSRDKLRRYIPRFEAHFSPFKAVDGNRANHQTAGDPSPQSTDTTVRSQKDRDKTTS